MKQVDNTALRFNQGMIIALLLGAFLLDQLWLVALVAVVMLAGTIWPQASLFKLIYSRLLRPAGLLQPDVRPDDPAQHLFAQGLGAIVLLCALLALRAGASTFGWLLVGVVVALAAVNLLFHFCLGCFIYYQLSRRGIRPVIPTWRAS